MQTAFLIPLLAIGAISVNAQPIHVLPTRSDSFRQSLNGDWSFKYLPALGAGADAGFYAPGFDASAWKKIPVPANWELHGFAEPKYALELKDGLGLYRRGFRFPADWRGRRVCLRLEGVAFGFEAWVNGTKIGTSAASAYNPNTFDITDALQPDPNADNLLALQVSTKPLGYEFDVNDDWALSGIFRNVTLFSVPAIHVQDLTTSTKLTKDGAADLSVAVTVNQPGGEVHGKLVAPNGETVREFDLVQGAKDRHEADVRVAQPQLWTAETPALYRLQLSLSAKSKPLQTFEERIGLREISIADSVLRLNGRPIKLRGVNHHDLDPETGRAITEPQMRRDLELMKKANINFVRTSHYSPQPRFIELCDEMGFYVMDEVSIGKGEEHLNDPAYRENILARVEPTITRDKNRPSVIIWSIGNENPITDVEMEAGRRAKDLDPSRPICMPKIGSYFAKNYGRIPEFVDIYSPHYPGNGLLHSWAKTLKRPLILTEYAHALGLATDRIQDQWEILQTTPTFAGGAVWHFMDQGILRNSESPVDRDKSTALVWLDKSRYYDTHGNDGCDGIVYADRTPQTDFCQVRKVYAPVQIAERSAAMKPGAQEISLTLENRHDFRSLAGMKLVWSLQRNGTQLQQGDLPLRAAAREKEDVRVPVTIPGDATGDILTLQVRCIDEAGLQVNERTVRLNLADAKPAAWLAGISDAHPAKVTQSQSEVKIEHPRWVITVGRPSGELTIRDRAGRVLVAGIYPHTGRKLTMTEGRSAGRYNTWRDSTLTNLVSSEIKVTEEGSAVRLSVSGTYPRPQPIKEKEVKRSDEPLDQADKPVRQQEIKDESFVGGYQAEIAPTGAITIRYDYAPTNATGKFSEAGLSLVLPSDLTEFRWIGQGPYAGYPGKDRLNEFGLFHLNREDLRYQGNRRETECALVTTVKGAGVALATSAADLAIERDGNKTLLSHNAIISGLGNKGTQPETFIDADKTSHLSGSFTLVLLDDTWPAALTRRFGQPATASDVLRPFYHSYDQ